MPTRQHFVLVVVSVIVFAVGIGTTFAFEQLQRKRNNTSCKLGCKTNKTIPPPQRSSETSVTEPLRINNIPESIIFEILCYLEARDLCILAQVNKKWNRISEDQYIWRNLVRRDYFDTDFTPDYDWKKFYKNWELSLRSSNDPFIFCCQSGITGEHFKKLWKLEEQKCHGPDGNKNYTSPLYHAVLYGKADMVKILITEYKQDPTGYLYLACKTTSPETARVLLENGVNVNASSPFESPIHLVSETDCTELMQILLDFNGDVNSENFRSQTPLQISAQHGKKKMVKFLLENNANPNIPIEYSGSDSLEGFSENEEIVQLLIDHGAPLDPKLFYWFGLPQ